MTNPYIQTEDNSKNEDAKHQFSQTKVETKLEAKGPINPDVAAYQAQNLANTTNVNNGFLPSIIPNFSANNFWQGVALGALGAYLLTNEKAQQTIFKGIVKMGKFFEAGAEEIKERFEDAKAEIEAGK